MAASAWLMPADASAQETPICTDRPAKANAVCTVPPNKLQLETSVADWTRLDAGGERSDLLVIGASTLKFGLSDRSDIELVFVPYAELTTKSAEGRRRTHGIGDLTLRYKRRLSDRQGPIQVAAIPFVKLPTAATGLGNKKVEGGVAVPVSFTLHGPVTMTLGPELDLLADTDGSGRHLAMVNLVNLSMAVAPRLTIAGELWSSLNFDPASTIKQVSLDAAAAYAATQQLQLDVGANFGLNRETPDAEAYVGVSIRF